jgi:hypothetical protein
MRAAPRICAAKVERRGNERWQRDASTVEVEGGPRTAAHQREPPRRHTVARVLPRLGDATEAG